jgi:hypothetical protein
MHRPEAEMGEQDSAGDSTETMWVPIFDAAAGLAFGGVVGYVSVRWPAGHQGPRTDQG